MPGDLVLPDVAPESLVPGPALERAERYERFLRIELVASQLVLLAVLGLYARSGVRFVRESAAGRIGTGMLLGMLGLALAWLSQVPFRLVEVWWERRYDQTDVGYVESLFVNWFALGAEFLFVSLALVIVMTLAGRFPRRWWIGAAPAFVALGLLFAFVLPYLFETEPADPWLRADATRYAAAQGIEPVRVAVEDVSEYTEAPNAYAAGLGPTRRVVLWSTLLDGRFSRDEVRVVLAHELAHHSRRHVLEGLAWYALLSVPGTWLVAVATRRRGGAGNPAAIPLALLVVVALQLLALPVENAVSRHMEREADWVALETTGKPDAARALFRAFTTEALADPDPPVWSRVLFDSHPPPVERAALAAAWRERER